MKKPILKQMLRPALALVAAVLLAGPSVAADVTLNLKAEARTVTMPDGSPPIPMWGFFDLADAGADWTPGPQPVGPAGRGYAHHQPDQHPDGAGRRSLYRGRRLL